MASAYIHAPEIWPPLAAAFLLVALSLYSWRRRSVAGALPLAVSSLFGVLWLLGIALEAASGTPATKIAWHKFQAVWQVPAVSAATCFALEYAYPGRWLTRRNLTLLALPSLLSLFLIVTNDSQFMWRRLQLGTDGAIVPTYAPLGAVLVAYGLGLVLLNTAALLWLFIRSPQHRWPVALILFGEIASRGTYLLNLTSPIAPTALDPAIFSILLVWTTYAIALFGFRIFDLVPAARKAAIDQMRDGMMVLDTQWQILGLNAAAESALGGSAGRVRGHTLQDILPACPHLMSRLTGTEPGSAEICLGMGPEAQYYALDLSPLKDHRGIVFGRLLMLRNVTEQRRAQGLILAQQWAQATLQEREQLAHELHDGLSQSLAFLNLQAQAAKVYLQTGQAEAAGANLGRLAEVSREMQGDVRELIGNLLAVSVPSGDFCSALRQALGRFEGQTGLAVNLEIACDASRVCDPTVLSPATGVQLLRIVQEALANVRKHAGSPNCVSVQLKAEAGQMHLVIEDNGAGFDPATPSATGSHFGLQVIRQRAARAGGQAVIHSAPGQGARVEVCVPLKPPGITIAPPANEP